MSLDPTHVPQVVSLAARGPVAPPARRWPDPRPQYSGGAHEHRSRVLLAVTQHTALLDLPAVSAWSANTTTSRAGVRTDRIEGVLYAVHSSEVREAIAAWAAALGGTVTETVEDRATSVRVAAVASWSGVEVSVRYWLFPDGRCADCDGPAVGATVLEHADDCPSAALPDGSTSDSFPDRACGCSSRHSRHADGCPTALAAAAAVIGGTQ